MSVPTLRAVLQINPNCLRTSLLHVSEKIASGESAEDLAAFTLYLLQGVFFRGDSLWELLRM
jgi:hypothetical protein